MTPTLQSLVVAVIVLACAVNVLRRLVPRLAWRLQARLAFACESPGRPRALRALGVRLRPAVPAVTSCGSEASPACSTCGSCATPVQAEPASQPSIPLRLA